MYKPEKVLVACEFSGRVRQAFKEQGFEAWSCDLLDTEIPGLHFKGDVREVLYDKWDLIIGFPPCTRLAVSGARWFKGREKEQEDAICFFRTLLNAPCERIAIENPVSVISTRIRKPDQIIQPWQFGEPEQKATCLWLKNLPKLKPTKVLNEREQRVWKESPGPDRWKRRSRTYLGIAKAMAEQWGNA